MIVDEIFAVPTSGRTPRLRKVSVDVLAEVSENCKYKLPEFTIAVEEPLVVPVPVVVLVTVNVVLVGTEAIVNVPL